jgi:hypothetical protein
VYTLCRTHLVSYCMMDYHNTHVLLHGLLHWPFILRADQALIPSTRLFLTESAMVYISMLYAGCSVVSSISAFNQILQRTLHIGYQSFHSLTLTYKNPGQWYEMLQIISQEVFMSSFFLFDWRILWTYWWQRHVNWLWF